MSYQYILSPRINLAKSLDIEINVQLSIHHGRHTGSSIRWHYRTRETMERARGGIDDGLIYAYNLGTASELALKGRVGVLVLVLGCVDLVVEGRADTGSWLGNHRGGRG